MSSSRELMLRHASTSEARGLLRRALRRSAFLAWFLVFAISAIAGFVLHLDTVRGRRLVARVTNDLVSDLLVSDLRIERIDGLGSTRLFVPRAALVDRLGKPVLLAENLDVRFDLVTLLAGIFAGDDVRVTIPEVRAERVLVGLTRDPETRRLTIETAFDPTHPRRGGPPPKRVFVKLSRIVADSASVTTNLEGLERASAKVHALSAALDVSPDGLVLSLASDQTTIANVLPREVRTRLRSELRLPGKTHAELEGRAGLAPASGTFVWQGTDFGFGLAATELSPEALRDLIGGWPLVVPLRGTARAHGPLESMRVQAAAFAGKTRVTGAGTLALTPRIASDIALHFEPLDLRIFDASAPETALAVDANVAVRFENGPKVEVTAKVAESEIAGTPVPPVKVHGTYARDEFVGTAEVLDPKLPTNVDFRVGPSGRVEFSSSSTGVDLAALGRFGVAAKGRATLRSRGVLDRGRLQATFDGTGSALEIGPARADTLRVRGSLDGPLAKPGELRGAVDGEGNRLDVGGASFRDFRVKSSGSLERQAVTFEGSSGDAAKLEASADLELGRRTTLGSVRLESRRGDAAVGVRAERVTLEAGAVTVHDLSLQSGGGELSGSITVSGRRRILDLTATNLDVGKILAALGVSTPGVRGRVDARAHVEEDGAERSGSATAKLRDGAWASVDSVEADVSATFNASEISADAAVEVRELGKGKLAARGSLRRSLFDPRAFAELTGQATLSFADVDLASASARWLEGTGVSVSGRATGEVSVVRTERVGPPELAYELGTKGLSISRAGQGDEPPSELRLDVKSKGELARTGGSRFSLDLEDAEGVWIALGLEHAFGVDGLLRAVDASGRRALFGAPIRARLVANPRPLRAFGGAGAPAIDGVFAGEADVTGTLERPDLAASASVTGSERGKGASDEHRLELALTYSAAQERYTLDAHTSSDADHVELKSSGRFSWLERGLGSDWSAKGEANVSRLDLARFGRLADVPVAGEVSLRGSFDLDRDTLEAQGDLTLNQLRIDQRVVGSGSGRLRILNGRAQANLRLTQGGSVVDLFGDAGFALARGAPELAPNSGGTVQATIQNFDLSSLSPLLRSVANRVAGRLDGRLEMSWGKRDARGRRASNLRANATVSNGSASLVVGGGLIQNVALQASADNDGPLRVTFSAAARSRKPNVKGNARVYLDGARLARVDARFNLAAFPLLYDGVLMGRATTAEHAPLAISVASSGDDQTVEVVVPALEVKLPEKEAESLIVLDDDRDIVVKDAPVDPDLERLRAVRPGRTTLKVRFGDKVRIVRGSLEVPVGGAIRLGPEGRLTGNITLRQGGIVPALGQVFRIRRGVVTFKDQDVKDGTIAIQAQTRVADGTVVDLDVSGTVRAPVIGFRSDPPRSEGEIVALLLGVQTTTDSKGEGEQLTRTAMALAMNRLVEGSILSGLQFGSGETNEGDTVSTVSVRVSQNVWIEGRSVHGNQNSVNPSERVSGVIDWRFAPSWSLRNQIGGVTGVELRWSYRY